ncbi:hypothetical protein Z959_08195 [Clostridium novyi B str. ATCC 27606]|uniref:Uncharacterized protein n=1 Tax=Clostridium novyi B str. ATCC 27606 TaxID=1443123 RepID=A0AA40IUL2_CLONO|nr:hypothetical protein [Clostridium novyi]KEI16962.1 hypothetical protein Z959_08195 [Clostridium novyi B str. ATCC 27606]
MGLYKVGTCSYCGDENQILRPSPFIADKGMMCKHCWDETQKEYAASNGEFIPDFNSNKKEYDNLKDDIENGIKVYQIFLEDMTGWTDKNIENFREELETTNDDYFRDEPDKHINVDFVMKCLELMEPGDEFSYKDVKFKCFKMTENTYNNLPEFTGW